MVKQEPSEYKFIYLFVDLKVLLPLTAFIYLVYLPLFSKLPLWGSLSLFIVLSSLFVYLDKKLKKYQKKVDDLEKERQGLLDSITMTESEIVSLNKEMTVIDFRLEALKRRIERDGTR